MGIYRTTLLFTLFLCHFATAQFRIIKPAKVPAEQDTPKINLTSLIKTLPTDIVKGMQACYGLNGEVYVTATQFGSVVFQRSTDKGKTWLRGFKIVGKTNNAWSYEVDGVSTNGLPSVVCDTGRGPYRGRIYICWGDEKYGSGDKDIFLSYSDDKGENWTEPVLVTYSPNHKAQFKPSMLLDYQTGRLYLLYFDQQNYVEKGFADVYMAISSNGGLKFEYYKVNKETLRLNPKEAPVAGIFTALKNKPAIFWTNRDEKNKKLVFQTTVSDSALNEYNRNYIKDEIQMERTLPFAGRMAIYFSCNHDMTMSAVITKPLLPGFEKVVVKNKKYRAGNNGLVIDTKALNLEKDNYVVTLYYNSRNTYAWIISDPE